MEVCLTPAAIDLTAWLNSTGYLLLALAGFSIIIFVHELGHFLAAKSVGVRVDRFAVGFGYRLFGWRPGEGFTLGHRPNYSPAQLAEKRYGETDYCFKALPIGGYVKMLGEEDVLINEKTGEMRFTDDPRAFVNKSVGARMWVTSAGVLFNLIFAFVVFVAVFMTFGKDTDAPILGAVDRQGAFAAAGLMPGDRILRVDGGAVRSSYEMVVAFLLGGDAVRVVAQRDGVELPERVVSRKRIVPADGAASVSLSIAADVPRAGLRPQDRITQANGRPVSSQRDLLAIFENSGGAPVELTLERPGASEPVRWAAQPGLLLLDADGAGSSALGLVPRPNAARVETGDPADKAGLKPGDVFVRFGPIQNPTYLEIVAHIRQCAAGDEIPAEVLRGPTRERVVLTFKPAREYRIWGAAPPRIGVEFSRIDLDEPVVAKTLPGTPAATLELPRGARIDSIAGAATADWDDIIRALTAAAGQTVPLTYSSGNETRTVDFRVPSSIVNELGLTPDVLITRIDGQSEVLDAEGKAHALPGWQAVRELLAARKGQEVQIELRRAYSTEPLAPRWYTVGDEVDPWQMRLRFIPPDLPLATVRENMNARGDLPGSIGLAASFSWGMLKQTYATLRAMATQRVPTDQVAGPIGIFGVAMKQAEAGWGDLLFFLAFLSINLAVINFLPMPVMDGGTMAFLILEKIRGRKLSLDVQLKITLAGLAVILVVFLFTTTQDVLKLIG